MTLLDLLDAPVPRDSHVVEPGEVRRLAGQNLRILAELQRGPMTRREIAAIGSNPTARISDIRKFVRPQGLDVKCTERKTGFSMYALVNR